MGGWLDRLNRAGIVVLAAGGVVVVGTVDYLTGYEISMSLFYLGPVALAAWYAGTRTGAAVAVFSCVCWYVADLGAGNRYSHPAIPVWNALIRFGFFLITGLLLAALRASLRRQQHLARTDALTGLEGRRAFDERLAHDLALAQRRRSVLTLAWIDLDDFKTVNDTHGHAVGDRVLRAVGDALRRSLRRADTAARMGGDEFALILPDTDLAGAQEIIARLTQGVRDAFGDGENRISCSIGVVTVLDPAVAAEHIMATADALMYDVKHQGKAAVAFRTL